MISRAQLMVKVVWRAEMRHVSLHNPRTRVEKHFQHRAMKCIGTSEYMSDFPQALSRGLQ